MFRLTGKPVADILLIFLWWPIAASVLLVVGLFSLISAANRRVDEADRRAGRRPRFPMDEGAKAARAQAAHEYTGRLPATDSDREVAVEIASRPLSENGITNDELNQLADLRLALGAATTRGELAAIADVPLETFGPVKAAPEPVLLRLKRHGALIAAMLGALLIVLGGVVQEYGIALLGCLAITAAVAAWTWSRAHGSRVWKTLGLAFLAWAVAISIAAVVAPPPETGPKSVGQGRPAPLYGRTTEPATPSTVPVVPTVPDVVGFDLPSARSSIAAFNLRSRTSDAAPLCRRAWDASWTVIATSPPPGRVVPPDETISLHVLRAEEAAWFAAHPTMPRLPKGIAAGSTTKDDGPLAGLQQLVLFRYAKGMAQKGALTAVDRPCSPYSNEPPEEVATRAGLKVSHSGSSIVVGSIPAAGQPVRPGQFIVLLVRDQEQRPTPKGSSSGRPPLPPRSGNDDDDFNIPGWLCPTRFC
ncbi:hypothetical protein [Micromonospora chalcea]|uniref:hypothetical protein n=1 Tax=Micromonospora chalcea TaxID=1874 RepID=UPI0037B0B099